MEISQIQYNINKLGLGVEFANKKRNYAIFNPNVTNMLLQSREKALPFIKNILNRENVPDNVVLNCLYILNQMIDSKVEGINEFYPVLSRYNNSKSPDIQVMLSGIYRKTLPPDAFGPLVRMLVNNISQDKSQNFDSSEEIGGAILEYLKFYSSINSAFLNK
ncbi:hypothetical protein IJ670_03585 [bacterium]|nr:hypothetical protein [bacterium]